MNPALKRLGGWTGACVPLMWSVLKGHADRLSPRRLITWADTISNPSQAPPHPPWDQAMSMLPASVNLTALSVNRSAQWLHRGASLLHLQAELPDVLLTWSLQLAGKYAPLTPTNSTSLSSYRPCNGGVLLGKSNTNKTTTQLPLICWTTTGFSVRLWSTRTGNVCTHW